MKNRVLILAPAAALVLSSVALAGAADAQTGPSAAGPSKRITVVVQDKKNDVVVPKAVNGVKPPKVTKTQRTASDIRSVQHIVNREAQTLTSTFRVKKTLRTGPVVAQVFGIVVTDTAGNRVELYAQPGSNTVRFADDTVCVGGTARTRAQSAQVVMKVPFTCLAPITNGTIGSRVVTEKNGIKAAVDSARTTRALPFTAYVAP